MLFSLNELLDVILMTLGVGFIFMDSFKVPRVVSFDWRALGWACLVTAPAVILHELGHKFVAIGFGADATFHAAYVFLAIGIFLKVIRSPIVFFVPGYVSIPATLATGPLALIALAGPGVNGIIYLIATGVLMRTQQLSRRAQLLWMFTRRINGLLFVFNLLPLPGFDGLKVFSAFF